MDFKDIPAEYGPYVGIGLTFGFMILVVVTGYLKFGLNKLSNRSEYSNHRVKQLEAKVASLEAKEAKHEQALEEKDIAWQAKMEQALEERDAQHATNLKTAVDQVKATFANDLAQMQRSYDDKAKEDEAAFTRQIQDIARNFADIQSQHNQSAANNRTALEHEISERQAMESENTLLHEAMENLNKRLQAIDKILEEQAAQIKAFKKTITEKDEKERMQGDLIKGLQELVRELQGKYNQVEARNTGIIDMARAIHLNIEGLTEDKSHGI